MKVRAVSLSTHKLSPACLTGMIDVLYSEFDWYVSLALDIPSSALPQHDHDIPLYLNIFRGEPAISGFDRHITPNHKSSHRFVTLTSSGLPPHFCGVHPAHG